MRLTAELEKLLNEAVRFAQEELNEYVSLEHVLLAMMDDKESRAIIVGCGGNLTALRQEVKKFIGEHCPKIDTKVLAETGAGEWKPALTLAFQRVVQRALIQVQSADKDVVTTGNLLISLLREDESPAAVFLHNQGVTHFSAVQFFSHGVGGETRPSAEPTAPQGAPEAEVPQASPLESYTVNLNERATKGLIDPLIGRDAEIERALQVLSRRTKNNVLLVGEPGVGKTAIADGLALRIVEGKVTGAMKDAVIYSLDMGSLLAGTRYRGDFEARFKGVVKELESKPHAILFIDEMHTMVGAGATSGGSMDASNLLKPSLVNRSMTVIGSTTYREYRAYLEKDQALLRRFQKIDVKEPSREETVQILEGLKSRYEAFHRVKYPSTVIRSAVELSARYLPSRPLPDKAIDVMDETGSRLRLKSPGEEIITVQTKDIESVVASVAQVPAKSVSQDDKKQLASLEPDLKAVIFGQDEAIHKLCAAIKLSRSGLRETHKPTGCFLFTGPTGVGKTEVCKQLARLLGNEFLRFDMSEYMEKHAVSRLVGAPPGYVGFDEGGLLTEAVFKNPYSVILFDEMEKAHPDIASILLQVMDNGKLTDTNGRTADFRHAIVVMTSNAGAREVAKPGIGIVQPVSQKRALDAVKQAFSPEFINRLDAVVPFQSLPEDVVLKVVDKFIAELAVTLKEKKVELEVGLKAKRWIYEKGYDPAYGARPLGRAIDEHLKKPLVEELLFGKLAKGGKVKVSVDSERNLKFVFSAG